MRNRIVRGRHAESGVSIVEMLVGVVLLAVVVVSLAASGLYSSRALARSRIQLESTEFQAAELERLLALPYDSLTDGARELDDGTSKWAITEQYTYRRILLITHYTPTEAISVWDTLVAFRLAP